jgi:hypothetical protein
MVGLALPMVEWTGNAKPSPIRQGRSTAILGRKRRQDDFKAEIAAHIEIETERLKEQGLSEPDARAAARRAFGNVTRAEERFYESSRWLWWTT